MKDKSAYDDKEKRDYQKEVIMEVLKSLKEQGFIECSMDKETINASIIPQKSAYLDIEDSTLRIEDFHRRGFSQSVDWVSALKALFAQLYLNEAKRGKSYTNKEIEKIINIKSRQIGRINKMIRDDFNGVAYDLYKYKVDEDRWFNEGHCLEISAFGFERKEKKKMSHID